jgi:DNA-directed RNA polymerase
MSFIRLKKRVTKTKENYYAYLVNNKWHKNLPKQKVALYLGRYHKLDPKQIKIVLPKHKNILVSLLKKELLLHNFKQNNSNLFIHSEGFIVDLKKNKVINKLTNNPICLGINQGFLCAYTLKNLLKFKLKSKNKKESGKILIRLLLESGIKPDKEQYLEVFNKLKIV